MLEEQEEEPVAPEDESGVVEEEPVEYLDILNAVGPDDCVMRIKSLEKTVEDLKLVVAYL